MSPGLSSPQGSNSALVRTSPLREPQMPMLRHERQLEALLRIGTAMAASLGLSNLLRGVWHSLEGVLDIELFLVALVDEAAGRLSFPLCACNGDELNLTPVDFFRDPSLVAIVVRHRQVVRSGETGLDDEPAQAAPGIPLPAAFLGVPLMSQGRAMGALLVGSRRAGAYSPRDKRFLQLVATQISLAVEKSRLYEAVLRHARSLEERVVARTAELQAEKTRFESTVQSLREGLVLFGLDGMTSFANRRASELLQVPLEELIGTHVKDLWQDVGPAILEREAFQESFQRALRAVETYPELDLCLRDPAAARERASEVLDAPESGRFLNLRLFPVRDTAGTRLGSGFILLDITREREMDRMKDELINVVSHELRTPISSVIGFAELLLTRQFPAPRQRQMIETIHREAERLSALINHFLDLRRLESGSEMMALQRVNLSKLTRSVAASFALNQKPHVLRLEVPETLPPVRADPERLAQALHNLISNAIKYSPDGGEVRVRAQLAQSEVVITISDDGLGLPAEAMPHLFQKFYRVDTSDRRKIRGTGLGLAIVRQIISAHGGRIWAESPGPGQGSTFGFTLPVAAPTTSSLKASAPDDPYVLVYESDHGQQALLCEHLKCGGYHVFSSGQPEVILQTLRRQKPIGVVLDVAPPDPDQGWGLLRAIRERYRTEELPILVTSVLDERETALSLGANEYLVKPFDSNRLIALLEQTAKRRVLVVDDDVMILELMQTTLTRSGYEVHCVQSGEAALDSLSDLEPDLVILDLMMPEMSGFDVLRALRDDGARRDLPVLVLTAKHLNEEDQQLLERYGAHVLPKGHYTAVRLRAVVEQALREARFPSHLAGALHEDICHDTQDPDRR